ncbi:hypothetical protein E2C01_002431 [Portunus trituberculatus]|uniref:Uncharacterized protein n=1 Tax=Portunus trituberculatus TaxID=210409 RepID=A0A5B7CQQ2_PORTR|nr:hypothetical protein [Portunus trituberculatus]
MPLTRTVGTLTPPPEPPPVSQGPVTAENATLHHSRSLDLTSPTRPTHPSSHTPSPLQSSRSLDAAPSAFHAYRGHLPAGGVVSPPSTHNSTYYPPNIPIHSPCAYNLTSYPLVIHYCSPSAPQHPAGRSHTPPHTPASPRPSSRSSVDTSWNLRRIPNNEEGEEREREREREQDTPLTPPYHLPEVAQLVEVEVRSRTTGLQQQLLQQTQDVADIKGMLHILLSRLK